MASPDCRLTRIPKDPPKLKKQMFYGVILAVYATLKLIHRLEINSNFPGTPTLDGGSLAKSLRTESPKCVEARVMHRCFNDND